MKPKAVSLISGGMDSTVLAYMLHETYDVSLISFNYRQRHIRELTYAKKTAEALNMRHDIIDLGDVGQVVASALTPQGPTEIEVPHGSYDEESMRATVVPNRNMIMLSIAAGVAITRDAEGVFFAAHAGDHAIYPDCRLRFVETLTFALQVANEGFCQPGFRVQAPFIGMTKADICNLGSQINVPFENTWSCYEGGQIHCGKCGTCCERLEAFALAKVKDPTLYKDNEFWKKAVGL